MNYEGTLYRPPSEARSLIFQLTIGCSHNKCTFCNMYKDKKFRIRNIDEVLEEIKEASKLYPSITRVFLADGDALIVKTENLIKILDCLYKSFKNLQRVGIYASPRSVELKSDKELKLLHEKGLSIAYLGLESGSNEILKDINKGETVEGIIQASNKLKNAGIKLSVTAISGIGGLEKTKEHALETAKAVSQIKPDYLGLLTLMIEEGTELKQSIEKGEITLLSPQEIAFETLMMLENIDAQGCVFRSNHASNYIDLRGTLNKDKENLIQTIKAALKEDNYKPEIYRRL